MQSDALATKGVLYAKIQLSQKMFIHVFNTHLQASYNDPSSLKLGDKYIKIRTNQLTTMREFVYQKTKDDQHPIILLGDFNVDARHETDHTQESDEYHIMLKTLAGDCFHVTDVLKDHLGHHPATVGDFYESDGKRVAKETVLTSYHDQGVPKRLDYIFWVTRISDAERAMGPEPTENDTLIAKDPDANTVVSLGEQTEFVPAKRLSLDEEPDDTPRDTALKQEVKEMLEDVLEIQDKSCNVAEMLSKGTIFRQLSDHYGVQCNLKVRKSRKRMSESQ
eukprot:TRINITY_DN2350_c0_g1_i1.p1 TRINITY_DN2350_c0_g1~~TRINITY_DN2350_c0_g1_i1.p1  ORF type:complete len:278 (+),score=79.02 TRINITY_DN2350_c0_g1_i1:523-1356(+)